MLPTLGYFGYLVEDVGIEPTLEEFQSSVLTHYTNLPLLSLSSLSLLVPMLGVRPKPTASQTVVLSLHHTPSIIGAPSGIWTRVTGLRVQRTRPYYAIGALLVLAEGFEPSFPTL